MVLEAIKALKERNGSSIQAIKKHITATNPALNFTPDQMRSALKKGVESSKFIRCDDIYIAMTSFGGKILGCPRLRFLWLVFSAVALFQELLR